MLDPPCFHQQFVPALRGLGQSISQFSAPKNLETVAGMLCPYSTRTFILGLDLTYRSIGEQ